MVMVVEVRILKKRIFHVTVCHTHRDDQNQLLACKYMPSVPSCRTSYKVRCTLNPSVVFLLRIKEQETRLTLREHDDVSELWAGIA
jgi:hypothetical protein